MTLQVIGAGLGRTGTYSLKLALNQLGFGPCHHMEEVLQQMPVQVPLWLAAAKGRADWAAIYDGYDSAVDWPTASFYRELNNAYPAAKFVLTVRSVESWVQSFSDTIYKLMAGREHAPKEMQSWLEMGEAVLGKAGFVDGLDTAALTKAFNAHNDAVKAVVPATQLLVYQVRDGWEPLCAFLGKAVPPDIFPRTNDRSEFWDRVSGKN